MVASKVTGGKSWGATGAAILKADLPKGMSPKEFLALNRRVRKGEGSEADQSVIKEVFKNAMLRRDGRTAAADGLDLRKKTNKKLLKKQSQNLKARRKQEEAQVKNRVERAMKSRHDRIVDAMNSAKTVQELESKIRPMVDGYWDKYPKVSPVRAVNAAIDKKQSPAYNQKEGRFYTQKEIDASPRIRAKIRRANAIEAKRLRTAESVDKYFEQMQEKYGNKLESTYEKLENKLPVGD